MAACEDAFLLWCLMWTKKKNYIETKYGKRENSSKKETVESKVLVMTNKQTIININTIKNEKPINISIV